MGPDRLTHFVIITVGQEAVAVDRLERGEPVTATVVGRLRASAGLYALSWVTIVWLMVAKPT